MSSHESTIELVSTLSSETDGINHINIYSKANTEIGRFLSNFHRVYLDTEDGVFESVEGYWWWLLTNHREKDILRKLHGSGAKTIGTAIRNIDLDVDSNEEFKRKISATITAKINNNEYMLGLLIKTFPLPLMHYYNYGGKIVIPKKHIWVMDVINNLRSEALKK